MELHLQLLSIEDVEKIMEETQEGIEYQRVSKILILSTSALSLSSKIVQVE